MAEQVGDHKATMLQERALIYQVQGHCSNLGITKELCGALRFEMEERDQTLANLDALLVYLRLGNEAAAKTRRCLADLQVLQTKLIPLVMAHSDDQQILVAITNMIVLLTLPTSQNAAFAVPLAQYKHALIQQIPSSDLCVVHVLFHVVPLKHFRDCVSQRGCTTVDDHLASRLRLFLTLLRNLLCIQNVTSAHGGSGGHHLCSVSESALEVVSKVCVCVLHLCSVTESSEFAVDV